MKRVYNVERTGSSRASRKVIQEKTARVRYADAKEFKRQCSLALAFLEGDTPSSAGLETMNGKATTT